MKGNTDKCHLLLSRNDETQLEIGDSLIRNSNSKKLLDVNIDKKISFYEYDKNICKKANSKLKVETPPECVFQCSV